MIAFFLIQLPYLQIEELIDITSTKMIFHFGIPISLFFFFLFIQIRYSKNNFDRHATVYIFLLYIFFCQFVDFNFNAMAAKLNINLVYSSYGMGLEFFFAKVI